MKKVTLIIALFAIIVLATGCVGVGSSITEEEIIDIGDTTMISVESSSADIEIIPEDREDISVVLHTYERGPKLTVSDGKTVHIEAKSERWKFFQVSFNNSPRLTIYVPEDYDQSMEIENSSGDLELNELTLDDLDIDLSSGDIRSKKLNINNGSIYSSSGDIIMKDINSAKLDIHSSSGDLKLEDFIGELEGDTSSGDVHITYKEVNSDIKYTTQSGDITVDFNGEPIDANFDLDCSSGNVSMNFDLDHVEKEKDNYVNGLMGEGTYQVKLHASSGDITIKK